MKTEYISPQLYYSDICESSLHAQTHVQVEGKWYTKIETILRRSLGEEGNKRGSRWRMIQECL